MIYSYFNLEAAPEKNFHDNVEEAYSSWYPKYEMVYNNQRLFLQFLVWNKNLLPIYFEDD